MGNLRRATLLFIGLVLAAPAVSAQQSVDITYRQRTEERISALDRQLRDITGQMERLQYRLRQANQRIDALEGELEAVRAAQIAPPAAPEGGTETAAVDGNQPGAPDQGGARGQLPDGAAQESYDTAYGLLGQGRFDEGEAAFRDFLRVHPEHKLAGNARYWIAETLYARQRYQEAATAFLEAWQADQRGAKAPDNLLKLGMSLQRLEKKPEACASFQKLLSDYRGALPRLRAAASRERSALGC